ncbi:hypothetical protein OsI_17735 [Oryza sativa Indica Group]|uniref:Uncharacterized protein n=1 Tax=Oryza sativa subsp. indica TaxID=39946 RepID=B8AVM2_ORYSI|nr:hypothetical protein OsI_17735 [Oryza sativa Indica Group]
MVAEGIALQTSLGQMLDLISTHTGADDLAKYSIEGYRRIVKYKTAYYSFYLPVANALLLSGAKLEDFSGLKDILIEMGIYFQIQDDYLDCFADPNTIGKELCRDKEKGSIFSEALMMMYLVWKSCSTMSGIPRPRLNFFKEMPALVQKGGSSSIQWWVSSLPFLN